VVLLEPTRANQSAKAGCKVVWDTAKAVYGRP
jgi:hypothetical protein